MILMMNNHKLWNIIKQNELNFLDLQSLLYLILNVQSPAYAKGVAIKSIFQLDKRSDMLNLT